MTNNETNELRILAPREVKPKLDSLARDVQEAVGAPISRRQALSLGGLAVLGLSAAACGTASTGTTGGGASTAPSGSSAAGALAGKPIENMLEIFNWSEYDDPSTYADFKKQSDVAAAGTQIHETYYASNDELIAKLNAGGAAYDIIVPSQNAVAQLIQEQKLMKLDTALIPNLSNIEPSFLKANFDPTGEYHVIKDFGVTGFYYNNKIVTEKIETLKDFYLALPKYVGKGRTNILDGAEEVVPLALMALGLDPNTDKDDELKQANDFLMSIRSGVTTISSDYIADASAGKIILGQGWSGDMRRVVEAHKATGDFTAILPTGSSEIWADAWCIPTTAPHPVAAHHWINWLCTPAVAVKEMEYHNYPVPIQSALDQIPAELKNDPLFNVPTSLTDNYHYILNVSPAVVQKRTKIYTDFKVAS
jgi:spermidine/putrescine-binding protein